MRYLFAAAVVAAALPLAAQAQDTGTPSATGSSTGAGTMGTTGTGTTGTDTMGQSGTSGGYGTDASGQTGTTTGGYGSDASGSSTSSGTGTDTAPDGSPAFGIEPYFALMGGYERFDRQANRPGIPVPPRNRNLDGGLVQGIVGVNVPLGPLFAGVEGNAAKGFSGEIDWEYGVAGRAGVRAGDSGLIYGKVGYQWVNFRRYADPNRDYHDWTLGMGVEVGPKSIGLGGLTGNAGVRLRLEVNTFSNFRSFQPMAGLVAHF